MLRESLPEPDGKVPIEAVRKLEAKLFREVPIASLSQDTRHSCLLLLMTMMEVNSMHWVTHRLFYPQLQLQIPKSACATIPACHELRVL